MLIRPIRDDAEHARALARIEQLAGAAPGSEAADELETWTLLVEAYETRDVEDVPRDPVDAIVLKMRELGISRAELARRVGWPTDRMIEVLQRRQPLTLPDAKVLAAELGLLVMA